MLVVRVMIIIEVIECETEEKKKKNDWRWRRKKRKIRKKKNEKKYVCVWAHVHQQTLILLLYCLSFSLTMQWRKTRPMRPSTKENGEYSYSDCCRFEKQTRDARDKALLVFYIYGIWNDQAKQTLSTSDCQLDQLILNKRKRNLIFIFLAICYLKKRLSKWRWQLFGSMFH